MNYIKPILIVLIISSNIFSHFCSDTSSNLKDAIKYRFENPWLLTVITGKVINKVNEHGLNILFPEGWHVSFSITVKVEETIYGKNICDTVIIIPGQSGNVESNFNDFNIGSTFLFFLANQIDVVWKEMEYPLCLYFGESCGFPVVKMLNNKFGDFEIDSLKNIFQIYDEQIIKMQNEKRNKAKSKE